MRKFISKLGHFKYSAHNLVAHPLMEVMHLIGLSKWGDYIHQNTLPLDHDLEHDK